MAMPLGTEPGGLETAAPSRYGIRSRRCRARHGSDQTVLVGVTARKMQRPSLALCRNALPRGRCPKSAVRPVDGLLYLGAESCPRA